MYITSLVFYLIHDKDIFNSHYSLHFGMVCKSEDLLWQFKIMAAKIILKISPYHAVQNVTYGGTFYPETLVKEGKSRA